MPPRRTGTRQKMKLAPTQPGEPKLVVRRARSADREAVLDIAKSTWGGSDYLPLVWDRWLADKTGVLLTATLGDRPVGVSKITVFGPGEIWLEGLRLHPDLRGRGLTKQINRAAFREAMKLKPRSIRYATGVDNAISRHLGEVRGFWLVARTKWMWGVARKRRSLASRPARIGDMDRVSSFVKSSSCYEATSGLYGIGWKFPELNRRRIRKLVKQGSVLIYPKRGRIEGMAIYDYGQVDRDICLGFLDGAPEALRALTKDVLAIAARRGDPDASAMLPVGPVADAAFKYGFNKTAPGRAIVFELGARGHTGDEPFESLLSRTLRAHESEAADRITDLLLAKAPGRLVRQNVRDFVMRHVLPDTERRISQAARSFGDQLPNFELRTLARGFLLHLVTKHGLGAESLRAGKRSLSFRHLGTKIGSIRYEAAGLTLTLISGPSIRITERKHLEDAKEAVDRAIAALAAE